MDKAPIIVTPRLILRVPQLNDAGALNLALNNSLTEIQKWMPWAHDASITSTIKFVEQSIKNWQDSKQKNFPLVVIHKEHNVIIGGSGYNEHSVPSVPLYEIGYWLATNYTNLGLATELTNALSRYALIVLKAARVQIIVQSDNIKSINVAKKCGFIHEAKLKNRRLDCLSKQPVDEDIFARFDLKNLPDLDVTW